MGNTAAVPLGDLVINEGLPYELANPVVARNPLATPPTTNNCHGTLIDTNHLIKTLYSHPCVDVHGTFGYHAEDGNDATVAHEKT